MTQEDIAKALGVTRPAITMWESGKSKPRVDMLDKLATLLGTTPAWLLGGDDAEGGPGTLEDRLLSAFGRLNEDGQLRVCEYAEDLVVGRRYRPGQ
jgi:putative transcriptional regulator